MAVPALGPVLGPVLVTGCSTGIGQATARHLAEREHTVYATARQLDSLSDLAAAGCRTLVLDVTDEGSMQAAVSTVEAEQAKPRTRARTATSRTASTRSRPAPTPANRRARPGRRQWPG